MTVYSKFEPFKEDPTQRNTTQPVSGGSGISFKGAQGISYLNNPRLRNSTVLPQFNAGREDFVIECLNFGATTTPVDPTVPFDDRNKVTAEAFLLDPNQFGELFFVGDYLPMNGVIEPLTIRDVASRETIEEPVSHRVRATIMCGNEDSFDGADIKGSYIPYNKNTDFVPFEDSSETIANGTIVVVGYVANSLDDKVEPFDESVLDARFSVNSDELNSVLLLMTGSSDDDFRPYNTKAATSGFIYSNKEGTDSLAFGGLSAS